tara:strand:+ start:1532 stop:2077 length:546 start_codon:yes stop_codon:yes gene_type:complete
MQEIICVLDISGSMQVVADDAKGGFNKFLEDQKKVGEANITIVWFDDGFKIKYEGKLSGAKPVDYWPPGGMTALRDAVGKTFNHVKERFTKEEPEKVIMAILTDGHENASKEFTQETVKALVMEHREKYNWDVIFLAADQDAWDTGQHYGIAMKNCINYSSNDTQRGFDSYSNLISSSRNS